MLIEILDLVKYSFIGGFALLILYKVLVSVLAKSKRDLFGEIRNEDVVDVEEEYPFLKKVKYTGFFFLLVGVCFLIVNEIPV